ncbi:MAG: hypothetical protein Q4A05_10800 [Ruminococcus sp.]|nr:hypothetical protein [Ruminococcus sp.]
MNKAVLIIHRILYAVNALILLGSVGFFLSKWSSLPREIGIHFGGDGDFDVVAAKVFGFYPHVIGAIIFAGMTVAFIVIRRKKTGLKITEKGENIFKAELIITLELFLMYCMMLVVMWTRSVSLQVSMETGLVGNITLIMLAVVTVGIISEVITCAVCRDKSEGAKSSMLGHRVARLVAWLLTFGGVWMLAESWVRHPADEELYFDPDYYGLAYFANLDRFLDKHWLIVPQVMVVVLLIVLEVISVRAVRSQKSALVKLTDDLKLFSGIFFFIVNMLLCSETRIGAGFVAFFAVLYLIAFILYFVRRKKESAAQT